MSVKTLIASAGLALILPGVATHAQGSKPAASPSPAASPAPSAEAPRKSGIDTNLNAKLPTDPSLVTGKLPNGISYVVKEHKNPEGRAAVWLHINTGALNETEQTRGIAHFLEHMAFNGSKNFPPGTVIDFFQALGLQFGRDQNASTGFDVTSYQLTLADNKIETIDKALLFMSDVAGRLTLPEKEIEAERGIILEERRTRLSAQQRVQEASLLQLAPGSTIGRRLPIGTVETIKSVKREDFVNYYTNNYAPANMTAIIVGDIDPKIAVERITAAYADLKDHPAAAPQPTNVTPTSEKRAVVITDPELTTCSVSISRTDLPTPPTLTVGDLRRDLVETIGTWAFNRRIAAKIEKGGQPYLSASSSSSDLFNALKVSAVQAQGKPENWRPMLVDIATELKRANAYGFLESEIADARAALITQVEESAKRESTAPGRAVIGRINGALSQREPIMSAGQRAELYKALLPGITAKEISEAFAKSFATDVFTATVECPASGAAPSQEDVMKVAENTLALEVERPVEQARAESLMATLPTPGTITEQTTHTGTNVTSAWLSNNVRVHYRKVEKPKGEVQINISLAGGEIQETAATKGTSGMAAAAFIQPATSKLTSTQIRTLMTPTGVSVTGGPGAESFTISVRGSAEKLEPGMQLAHLLLTDPVIEPALFDRIKQLQLRGIEQRKTTIEGLRAEALAEATLPESEIRTRPVTKEQVEAMSYPAAAAWLKKAIAESPIEVAVVGDIEPDAAMALVTRYLGSLPKRERISDKTYADLRHIHRKPGPIDVTKTLKTQTDKASVLVAFTGPDLTEVNDVRLMQLAGNIVTTRMVKVIREEKQLVYSINARFEPVSSYRGLSSFAASAPTDPVKAAELPAAVRAIFDDFAKTGPTEEELTVARTQLIKTIEEAMKEPGFWMARLTAMEYRGSKLDDVTTLLDFYKNATADQVRAAFAKYNKPENQFSITAKPE